ncbi:MAG: ankyrin repeat domain-containing protein, partial [Alphaproteobacteria bacterium]
MKSTVKRGRLFDQMTSYQALEYVEKLREEGKNVNVTDSNGQTLLHRHPVMASALIQNGLDPNLLDDHGDTPLIIAARKGKVVTALIQATSKENLNKIYEDGRTILTTLLTKTDIEYSGLRLWSLLEAGADPDLADKFGKTPLQIWTENKHYLGYQGRESALELIKYGAKADGIMMTVESRQKHTYQIP